MIQKLAALQIFDDCRNVFPVSGPGGWFEFAKCTLLAILLEAEDNSGGHSSESPFACRRLFPLADVTCCRHVRHKLGCMAVQIALLRKCFTALHVVKHFRGCSGSSSRVRWSQIGLRIMRDGGTCQIGMCMSWCFLASPREFAPRVVHLPTDGSAGFWGHVNWVSSHNWERLGSSGQTHVSLRSSVYHRHRSLFGSSVWSSSVSVSGGQP